jgi:nicotinamidase-related amidase
MTDVPNYVPCLVIIDVQQGMFSFRRPLYQGKEVLARIAGLLAGARGALVPIFHVQHDGGPGHILAKGSIGWPHHAAVQPRSGEAIVEKRYSSAFHDTDFHSRLTEAGVDRLVVAGIQTEMCVDSTCRAAVALGYKVMLVWDAHTTFDSPVLPAEKIIAHHNRTLADGFVDLVSASDVVLWG